MTMMMMMIYLSKHIVDVQFATLKNQRVIARTRVATFYSHHN